MCKVSGLNRKQFDELRIQTLYKERTGRWIQEFVKDKRTGKRVIDPKTKKPKKRSVPEILKHFLMDKRCQFPTGLLYIVEDFLLKGKIKFKYNDTRVRPELNQPQWSKVKFTPEFESYPEQVAAGVAAVDYERGIIVGPTGVGKSAIGAEVINRFRVNTLLVVPSLELKRQLTEGLRQTFGADNVGPLYQGQPQYLITVENVDALDPKVRIQGIDLVIVDEFHHSGARTYRELNRHAWADVYFKIGLTATPFRSRDDERLLLESVLSHVIFRIEYQEAVRLKRIVPLEAYYVELPIKKLRCSGLQWASVYKELVVERTDRNEIIANILSNLNAAGVSTLCLVKQVEHGKAIQLLAGDIPFVKGENDDNREVIKAFCRKEFAGMLGTNGILGEGVDTKPCEWVILAGLGKSKNAFMQQVGRCFRIYVDKESGKILLFYDPSHEWMVEHFKAQCKYLLEEYGIRPTKLIL